MKYTIYIAAKKNCRVSFCFFRCFLLQSDCGPIDGLYPLTAKARAFVISDEGGEGAFQSYIEVRFEGEKKGFTFIPKDVFAGDAIFSSYLGIAVTREDVPHDYEIVARNVAERRLKTRVCRVEETPETTLAQADKLTWHRCPTFLTVPGNVQLFEIGFRGFPIEEKQHMDLYDYVVPRMNWDRLDFGNGAERVVYRYLLGRGMGCKTRLRRSLYKGYIPVLRANLDDGGIRYSAEYFADTLFGRLDENKGTHYLEADFHSAGHMLTERQEEERLRLPQEKEEDMPLLRMRITMRNKSSVPKYAFLRLPHINTPVMSESDTLTQKFENGFGFFGDKVYMTAFSEGRPVDNIEVAYLLPPEGKKEIDIVLFFKPICAELAKRSFDLFHVRKRLAIQRWQNLLGRLGEWHLPERRIDEAVKAGFLQLRASCFGSKNSDVFAPCVGVYSPIATESIAVVEVLSSFGAVDFAKKCVNYFYAKQHEDGFIQNMTNYMAETGGALYLTGRIFRESNDTVWLESLRKNICSAVTYLAEWMARNEEGGRIGYGMLDGQIADPKDPYRAYSLNALACAGLFESSKLLNALNDPMAEQAERLAQKLTAAVRAAYAESEIRAVLVPLENGEWAPLPAPWAEERTGCCLHLNGGSCVTHASAVSKDSLLSGAILFVFGILSETGEEAKNFIAVQTDLFADHMTYFSQPYYNVVPYLNLYRGERHSFLREYYTAFATMCDRETYSFWEHYFLATPHKTAEQGAFLLRTRMMLYYERENKLYLLSGIPHAWLQEGKRIYIEKAVCGFGTFSLGVQAEKECVSVKIECEWSSKGKVDIIWQLPGKKVLSTSLSSGNYSFSF